MDLLIDANVVIAGVMNEPERDVLLKATAGQSLIAPASLPWEIGNAFAAMFKRRRIRIEQAIAALKLYQQMPIKLYDVDVEAALILSDQLGIYAYDAYIL